ncbi:BnaA10g28460D [Brassica napus]|uniref:BnaA10g28460D protein n=1 Tax=Brassica napus TaxID=3708 RepID=A0A078ISN1_BRANA|nr:BnaA10g28460D [Brassica napus]
MDDKTGKMTVVGEVDTPVLVMKLRKLCNAEIVSPEPAKPAPAKPDTAKPAEIVAFPVTHMNYPYQYHSSFANSHYQPYGNSRVVVEEPNTCVLM